MSVSVSIHAPMTSSLMKNARLIRQGILTKAKPVSPDAEFPAPATFAFGVAVSTSLTNAAGVMLKGYSFSFDARYTSKQYSNVKALILTLMETWCKYVFVVISRAIQNYDKRRHNGVRIQVSHGSPAVVGTHLSVIILGILARFLHLLTKAGAEHDGRVIYAISFAVISTLYSILFMPPFMHAFLALPADFVLFVTWLVAFCLLIVYIVSSVRRYYPFPVLGPGDINYDGCGQWRAVLAFSFIVSFTYLVSAILGCSMLAGGNLKSGQTKDEAIVAFRLDGMVLFGRSTLAYQREIVASFELPRTVWYGVALLCARGDSARVDSWKAQVIGAQRARSAFSSQDPVRAGAS
ncbi:hypothetical protein B0T26DRAFT_779390 [Lasiosphaeria miniovina]|uniref:MARVEL domain-containing protein n=1 Tax=Lasiosphaeria miniovina TaxID=1954250 RepID=A0AA40AAN7_9PEZI|nr:uncharacterized protein B0T26DRAFT_779390 [Lasiosphaeria miniovina]KAK0712381.1 hypothetical protein B0T26DRAFT_779390 [Lasiosphaeria miniovina]